MYYVSVSQKIIIVCWKLKCIYLTKLYTCCFRDYGILRLVQLLKNPGQIGLLAAASGSGPWSERDQSLGESRLP